MVHIREYDPTVDGPGLLELWHRALSSGNTGPIWPLSSTWFNAISLDPRERQDHLLAEVDGQLIGFGLVQVNRNTPHHGSLLALAVHPNYRRLGVGRRLHDAALDRLRACGVQQVQLGAGAVNYFWPGVPVDLPGAWAFFQALGWTKAEHSFDLTRSLDDYQTPAWVWERLRGLGLDLVYADKAGLEKEAIDFVSVEYPGWAIYFVQAIGEGRARDVLLARRSGSAEILGVCLVESQDQRWDQRLPQPVGAPGCFLTAEAARNRGIGMALAALATETLQARGCRTSFIGWTWLVDWYGKLGYKIWQEYIMSWMDLNEKER